MQDESVIVVDIGKTMSKVTLWSREGVLLDRQVRPNARCILDGIKRLDCEGIGAWLVEALSRYSCRNVATIIPVAHGAGVVALANGALAFQPLDYEQSIPPEINAAYRAERDPFRLTGSPALPDGLNIGCQLYWLEKLYPEVMRCAELLPWAQYWAWFLSGTAASEVTSLACHSDLWLPGECRFSPMAVRLGWAERFAPRMRANEVAGPLRPELSNITGLPAGAQVFVGLHDSNAALLAPRGLEEIARKEATILSTGTWFIAMRTPMEHVNIASLSEGQDCLVNVDVNGWRIPSARFMGGREIEIAVGKDVNRIDIVADQPDLLAVADEVVNANAMLLPAFVPDSGPFPQARGAWLNRPSGLLHFRTAVSLYAALMTDTSLDLIGSKELLLIEGRFAQCDVFVRALATLRPGTTVFTASAESDVSFGALRLTNSWLKPAGGLKRALPLEVDLETYRSRWRSAIGENSGKRPA